MVTDMRKAAMKPLQVQLNLRTVQQRNIRTAKSHQEQSIMRMDAITRKWNMTNRATRLMKKFMNKPYQHIYMTTDIVVYNRK